MRVVKYVIGLLAFNLPVVVALEFCWQRSMGDWVLGVYGIFCPIAGIGSAILLSHSKYADKKFCQKYCDGFLLYYGVYAIVMAIEAFIAFILSNSCLCLSCLRGSGLALAIGIAWALLDVTPFSKWMLKDW